MLDVTLTFRGKSFASKLSTYRVTHVVEYYNNGVTMDGTEYGYTRRRPVVTFTFMPLTDAECQDFYGALSQIVGSATYTDPHLGERTCQMRVASDLEAVFGIRSINGNRYYKGGEITLRSLTTL